jgi:hypothetical protein
VIFDVTPASFTRKGILVICTSVLLALIAVIVIASLLVLGPKIADVFTAVAGKL